jgi:LAO/AO transport system kinase
MDMIDAICEGNTRAVARAISLIENHASERERLMSGLSCATGRALILGVTGPPGAGKSTLVDRLIRRERDRDRRVAVIAVDPSSPFSGGALLGDRLRMQEHAADPRVFIRSMATRGCLGGVARATGDAVKVFDAAGFETVIIETVGVGQAEIGIVRLSDIVLLILVPGMGDEIQVMKAGIMEIGDIFVINKSDRDGADRLKAQIDYMLSLRDDDAPKVPVLMTCATMDEGIDELHDAAHTCCRGMDRSGVKTRRRKQRIEQELRSILMERLGDLLESRLGFEEHAHEWVDLVYRKEVDPYALVNERLADIMDAGASAERRLDLQGKP